jgi:hypothetical protein
MKASVAVAIVLIVAGVFGLAYGWVTYTRDRNHTQIAPLDIAIGDRETVTVPIWAGMASIAIGGGILLLPLLGRAGGAPIVIPRKI